MGTGNLMLWAVPFLRDVYGLSTTRAAACASAPAVALLFAGPLTGYVSDHVVRRRKLPYVALAGSSFALWLVFVLTLGSLPVGGSTRCSSRWERSAVPSSSPGRSAAR